MILKEYESLVFRTKLQIIRDLVWDVRIDNEELKLVDQDLLDQMTSNLRVMVFKLCPLVEDM